jgi:multicomponent Na+:H+ antiporter subunit G
VTLIVDAASFVLILAGSFFIVAGGLGLMRMPDVFTRMHAASVIETLGAGLLFIGFMLQAGFTLISAKLLFLLALIFFTGPVVTHALAQAALQAGIRPYLAEDRTDRPDGPPKGSAGPRRTGEEG